MPRFDYIEYDDDGKKMQAIFKESFEKLEVELGFLGISREASLAVTNLEQAYMWAGKALKVRQEKMNESKGEK